MDQKLFSIEPRDKKVWILTINRPKVLNALNFELLKNLKEAFLGFKQDPDARILILTGQGQKAFCAGADIQELRGRHIFDEKQGMLLGQETFNTLEEIGKPSIAAINGYALGGGLEMALACTFRLASPNARLGLPEINLGLIPGYGGTQRLTRLVGQAKALQMILTGKPIKAEEALQFGLLYKMTAQEKLMDECLSLADQLCQYSPLTISLAMESVLRGRDVPLKEGLTLEADLGTIAYNTEDGREGLAAFVEKRKPEFKGR
ncbi:MAG: enoyl-CoA hydratase-related protein [Desulfobacterales bacterium]